MRKTLIALVLIGLAGCQALPSKEEWNAMTPADKEYWQMQKAESDRKRNAIAEVLRRQSQRHHEQSLMWGSKY